MSTFRERCKQMLWKLQRDAMLRQGSPVDDLMAFVIEEHGRKADKSLDKTLPLCLYFANEEDRDEFIALVHEAKPNMICKKFP